MALPQAWLAGFLEILAGVRPGRRALDIDLRLDRNADEERQLFRVVIHHVDADREPLHDFHKVARRILRRQQRKRGARCPS
jgi:hypothetical protein